MQELHGKKILLGLTGGIACYKAAELLRLLTKAGAQVQVMMSEAACHFITCALTPLYQSRQHRLDRS